MEEKNSSASVCCSMKQNNGNHENGHEQTSRCAALTSQLELCQKELSEWREKSMRAYADFENYKRRSERERTQWIHGAQRDVLLSILPILDDAERGLIELQKKEHTPEMDVWFSGFSMIAQSLQKLLKQWNVTEITEIESFNPELHEAIVSVEAEGKQSGDIVQVLQKGYRLHDEILRPAKVSVAK